MAIMIPKQQHLQALFFWALFLLANKVHSQDVTSFTFSTFSAKPTNLTYQGGTHVPPGSNFLRLTKTDSSGVPRSWTVGRVLYSCPVQFWESSRQATFETTIRFVITPGPKGAADGLAFFIAPVGTTIPRGSDGANLGIFGSSGTVDALFAVEFDTYVNSNWDHPYRHIGINVKSRESNATAAFDSATGKVVTALINYNANTRTVTVVASSGSQSAVLSYVVDLKTVVPQRVQVGISSATGANPRELGIHDIHSWYFTSSLVQDSAQTYIRQAV